LPPADFPGTPIEALKSLAKAAAGRMH